MDQNSVTVYAVEKFTDSERDILRRYFTNLDSPVFALVNLPEVVKGALFARYSRTHKSLRRLFLDEFVGELEIDGDHGIDATVGVQRAEQLYDKVFHEFGDDSVAQLGGVHLACEQSSNLLTKILEWGRLASYLEQSTRYLAYDTRIDGRYRYFRDPDILASHIGARYVGELDRIFDTYSTLLPLMQEHFRKVHPKTSRDSDFAYRQALRAKTFDVLRGLLPAAALSNVGIYGSGQAYESMLIRMRAHPLPEARQYADLMLTELRKVIPSFLKRVDLPNRGGAWSNYFAQNRNAMQEVSARLMESVEPESSDLVTLVDYDPEGELKLVASMLYPFTRLPEAQLLAEVSKLSDGQRQEVCDAYVGDRLNRRHRPGRGLERTFYRFDVLSDYGAFRDLQRHRMMTVEWQRLTPEHGFSCPEAVIEAGAGDAYNEAIQRSGDLYELLLEPFPAQASYAVSMAYRVRYTMQFNVREAMHLIELRTAPQGHESYRLVCQQMATLIEKQAGHKSVARMLRYLDKSGSALGRLDAETKNAAKQ